MNRNVLRKSIHKKYDGKCGYCGCDITLKSMQIDHLIPLRRGDSDDTLKKYGIERGTDTIDNLMPSCGSCNHYKSTFSLEEFRTQLTLLRDRLNKTSVIYNISKRYGLINENPNLIEFYFEKIN